jgi:hypothetical protein
VTLECGDMSPLSKRGHVRALHNHDEIRMTSDERMTKSGARNKGMAFPHLQFPTTIALSC